MFLSISLQNLGFHLYGNQSVPDPQQSCMKNTGYGFIALEWCPGDKKECIDLTTQNFAAAKKAGFKINTFIFTKNVEADKIIDACKALKSSALNDVSPVLYIAPEIKKGANKEEQISKITQIVSGCQAALGNDKVGVWVSKEDWEEHYNNVKSCSSTKLWYTNFDTDDNFDSYEEFGGWTKPTIKTFANFQYLCGLYYDNDYMLD